MADREKLIELMKEVKFPTFPGGGLDVSVANQLPDHAFEAIARHLLANGVTIPVRCKNCIHHRRDVEPCHGKTHHFCKVLGIEVYNDFFCPRGWPKEQTK